MLERRRARMQEALQAKERAQAGAKRAHELVDIERATNINDDVARRTVQEHSTIA